MDSFRIALLLGRGRHAQAVRELSADCKQVMMTTMMIIIITSTRTPSPCDGAHTTRTWVMSTQKHVESVCEYREPVDPAAAAHNRRNDGN